MGIVDDDIVRLRENTDIVQVISNYTQLRKVGRRFTGLCPFHTEKSPSFSVNSEAGLYYCFGCQAKGDAITFVREQEQLDFVGAVEWLAAKSDVTLRYTDKNEGEDRKRKARLHDTLAKAVDWYHERLMTGKDAAAARSYLRQRGYDGDVVREYQIGWAPDAWDQLSKSLRVPNKDWVDSGLGNLNNRGGQYDFFRGRVLFPIFDAQGKAMGFGGRILPGSDDPAKYRNSADSGVYHKSRVLYGLNWAKTDIVAVDEVIVCEGYTDVIGYGQAGVGRAVATCGTALTEEHVKMLSRFARRVVLSFDADAAGQNAAAKFYEWEKKHNLDVAVADLPDGVDPGDLARSDPALLADAIANAKPFLGFRVERALKAGNMATVEGRARTAETALEMVAEHPDPLVKDQYAMEIAGHCRIETDLVREILAQGPKRVAEPRPDLRRPVQRRDDRDSPETEGLRLLIHQADTMRSLVLAELFVDELYSAVFDQLARFESLHDAISDSSPAIADVIQRLSVEDSTAEAEDVAGRLWTHYLQRRIADHQMQARTAKTPADIAAFSSDNAWYLSQLDALQDPTRRGPAVEGLLGWLTTASGDPS